MKNKSHHGLKCKFPCDRYVPNKRTALWALYPSYSSLLSFLNWPFIPLYFLCTAEPVPTLYSSFPKKPHATLKRHLLYRRGIGLQTDPVERSIHTLKGHILRNQWEMTRVYGDAVHREHITHLLQRQQEYKGWKWLVNTRRGSPSFCTIRHKPHLRFHYTPDNCVRLVAILELLSDQNMKRKDKFDVNIMFRTLQYFVTYWTANYQITSQTSY